MAKKKQGPKKVPSSVVALIVGVCCLVAGLLVGRFMLAPRDASNPLNSVTLSAAELDTVVATYTYGGERHEITAREVIEDGSSLEMALNADGTYAMPSADAVLGYARNAIVLSEAQARDITVTDEDISAYAMEVLGTDDYTTIASAYGYTEDTVRRMLGESAVMKGLRDQVLAEVGVGEAPTAPEEPEDGNRDTASQEYADYVIALLGDEWDAENNTWARTDGAYYATLQTFPISNEEATYEAAEQAFFIAYQDYAAASSNASQEWTNYVNGLLSSASIEIATLGV